MSTKLSTLNFSDPDRDLDLKENWYSKAFIRKTDDMQES